MVSEKDVEVHLFLLRLILVRWIDRRWIEQDYFRDNVMIKPHFITFTGLDKKTDLVRAKELADQYPVEFGVLMSPSRQGIDNRFPSRQFIKQISNAGFRRLSAHICGDYSRGVMDGMLSSIPYNFDDAGRVQVNSVRPDPGRIAFFADSLSMRGIAQCRGHSFPDDERIDWLFDTSGGRGNQPLWWPSHPGGRLVGYSGGISPFNVIETLKKIASDSPYWIDMESGVRTGGWFDLNLCEQVCKAVYG